MDGGALMVSRGEDRLGFVVWRRRSAAVTSYYWEIGWRDGSWRDGVTYSILRTDPEA